MKKLIIPVVLALFSPNVKAETVTCAQGPTSSSFEWNQNVSARRGGKTTEICATNSAGGTDVTTATTALVARKAVELQNLGPNAVYCTVDGQAPLSTGVLGRKIDASGGVWSLDAGPLIRIRCIAATAAQTTGACIQVTELR